MKNTSLCYIERAGQYLMLHRIKKAQDENQGKWIGVGGHFEEDESPEECMMREVREETGLEVTGYRYVGIVTFVSDQWEGEYMHLFHVDGFSGSIKECDEGHLEWMDKEAVSKLPMWEGDGIFLRLMEEGIPFFSLKLCYKGEHLEQAILNGKRYLSAQKKNESDKCLLKKEQ